MASSVAPSYQVSRALIPSFSVVDSAAEVEHYKTELRRLWGSKGSSFPGSNPVSMSREGLGHLKHGEYLISLKSDGVRYVLLCTTRPGTDDDGVALLIDRAWNMYEVEVVAPADFFLKRTVLEGELVWEQPDGVRMLYLVFDCIVCKGALMTQKSFYERLECAQSVTKSSAELSALPTNQVEEMALETDSIVFVHYEPQVVCKPKRFIAIEHALHLWESRADADHRVDGIIANRATDPYVCGSALHGCAFKWKEFSTVDVQGVPPALRLRDAPLPSRVAGRSVELLPSHIVAPGDDAIVEYLVTVTETEVRLFAMRLRSDKLDANTLRVFELTVQDVSDHVSVCELTSA